MSCGAPTGQGLTLCRVGELFGMQGDWIESGNYHE